MADKKRNRVGGKWAGSMVIVGGITAVVAGGALFYNAQQGSKIGSSSVDVIDGEGASKIRRVGEGNPSYNRKINESAALKAEAAESKGVSFIAPLTVNKRPLIAPVLTLKKKEPESAGALVVKKQKTREEMRQEQATRRSAIANAKELSDAMRIKMESVLASRYYTEHQGIVTRQGNEQSEKLLLAEADEEKLKAKYKTDRGFALKNGFDEGVGSIADKSIDDAPFKIGEIIYAVNDLTINSDENNPIVRATLLSGKAKGGVIMGSFKRVNSSLVIEFTQLVAADGRVFGFQGYAIQASEQKASVNVDVNHHYFQRWGGLIASSFMEGFGSAISNRGQTSIATVATTETTIPDFSSKDQSLIALGKVGERLSEKADDFFDRPPTVVFPANATFGLLIMDR